MLQRGALLFGFFLVAHLAGSAQGRDEGWWQRYQERVSRTQAQQPTWVTPLVTVTPRLEQEWRTDFVRQRNARGYDTWSLGAMRGPETIPFGPTQITFGLPPFLDGTMPGQHDGFADVSFLMKYRLFAKNEQQGNAIVTLFLGSTLPTGKNNNGLCCATVTPTLAAGKGWGHWDIVSTAGCSLPVTNASGLGHAITWNTTAQYHVAQTGIARFVWPEIESNTTFFAGGANDGQTQEFVTPGVILGRMPVHLHTGGPRAAALVVGAGEQIATTHFHAYNHALVVTLRVPF